MKPDLCAESGCALAKIGTGFTDVEIGPRYSTTRLLMIGEASGEAESRESLPFRPHAQSGSLLTDAMREVNVSRSEVAITNVIRCRPPKDWLEGAPWAYSALSHCTENYLKGVIDELKPKAILALGGTAYRSLTAAPRGRYGTLDYARGYVVPGAGVAAGIKVIATYHPAYLRRGAAHLTPLLQRDIRRAFNVATGKLVEGRHFSLDAGTFGLKYQTAPTVGEAWEWARSANPDLKLSFDLETPMSTRSDEEDRTSFTDRDIKLVQFSQCRGTGIAMPWRDQFVDVALSVFDRCPRKVGFNNWNFDDAVLEANGVLVGVTDDAMVKFGAYWSDLPKNLQTAAQMCGFPFPWKHLGESDLAFYGVCDVDAALCVDDHMDRVLAGEEVAA